MNASSADESCMGSDLAKALSPGQVSPARGLWWPFLFLFVSVAFLAGGCRNKRRYDGNCDIDSHCLEFQRCSSGVCVRRKPIFEDKPLPQRKRPARPRAPRKLFNFAKEPALGPGEKKLAAPVGPKIRRFKKRDRKPTKRTFIRREKPASGDKRSRYLFRLKA